MKRRLLIESLENRLACAGNVTVVQDGPKLTITGDVNPNAISIVMNDSEELVVSGQNFHGSYTAAGLPVNSGQATKINNSATPKQYSLVSSLIIRTNGGNDAITMGDDLQNIKLTTLNINTGLARDFVSIKNMQLEGTASLTVKTHKAAGAAAATEAGDDRVLLSSILGNAQVTTLVSTGGGNDVINVDSVYFSTAVNLFTGNGADRITVAHTYFGKTTVNTGAGEQRGVCSFVDSTVASLDATFGAGNDLLTFSEETHVEGLAKLRGGAGKDKLTISANSQLPHKDVTGFNP